MVVRSKRTWAALVPALACLACQHTSAQGRLFAGRAPDGVPAAHDGRAEAAHDSRLGAAAREEPATGTPPVEGGDARLPLGRDIASLTPADCVDLLDRSLVRFDQLPDDAAPTVAAPVYVRAPLYGVSFGPKSG